MDSIDQGKALALAAETLVGVPFRVHGRDPRIGLDCIGLVEAALTEIGRPVAFPDDYRLHGGAVARCDDWAERIGLGDVCPDMAPAAGDILLCQPAPTQLHLMIQAAGGVVHAHAGLRRVVRSPVNAQWPVRRRWGLFGAAG